MQITQSYPAPSSVGAHGNGLGFSLATEASRPGVHLQAMVRHSRAYGRVMLALHRVVSGDARFQAADHSDYQQWVQAQYLRELAPQLQELQGQLPILQQELSDLHGQLQPLDQNAEELYRKLQKIGHGGATQYYEAQRRFWNYLYKRNFAMWLVLDPVVSVHADAVLFEVFSRDESSYACVRVPSQNLETVSQTTYGTTNVDYSRALADEMERVRDYRSAFLSVGSEGVSVQTTAGARVEKKIDLPPSWVRGFLQVQSASALSTTEVKLSATTVAEILRLLKARKETTGPRSLRFYLVPGQGPIVEIEPWGQKVEEKRFVFEGAHETSIRIWGRRRLSVLSDLLPHAEMVEVRLLGDGLPSFWALELEGHRFELGLSGWTQNDWSAAARFDALASTGEVKVASLELAASELQERLVLSPAELAQLSDISRVEATRALQKLCREGRAMFDSKIAAYRWRQLLPFAAPDSPEEAKSKSARRWVAQDNVQLQPLTASEVENDDFLQRYSAPDVEFHRAVVRSEGGEFRPLWGRDADGRVRFWQCTCAEWRREKGRTGPCAHLLAGLQKLEQGGGAQ